MPQLKITHAAVKIKDPMCCHQRNKLIKTIAAQGSDLHLERFSAVPSVKLVSRDFTARGSSINLCSSESVTCNQSDQWVDHSQGSVNAVQREEGQQ